MDLVNNTRFQRAHLIFKKPCKQINKQDYHLFDIFCFLCFFFLVAPFRLDIFSHHKIAFAEKPENKKRLPYLHGKLSGVSSLSKEIT